MHRRRLLTLGGVTVPIVLAGCIQPPGGGDGSPSEGVSVRIVGRDDQPGVPIEYDLEMVESLATRDHPARLGVSITNPGDTKVVLGEERDIQFHHVASTDESLYLHPAGEGTDRGPVEAGCWRMTDYVAVPEYYGTVPLEAGETIQAESYVYGHPELPDSSCLPEGEHRIHTTGVYGDHEDAFDDRSDLTDFEWGFTLQIGESEQSDLE